MRTEIQHLTQKTYTFIVNGEEIVMTSLDGRNMQLAAEEALRKSKNSHRHIGEFQIICNDINYQTVAGLSVPDAILFTDEPTLECVPDGMPIFVVLKAGVGA